MRSSSVLARCTLAAVSLGVVVTPLTLAAQQARAAAPITAAEVDAHLRFLSSDLLEGRAPATRGGQLAAEYIASELREDGVLPGVNGSYFQDVPIDIVGARQQTIRVSTGGKAPKHMRVQVIRIDNGDAITIPPGTPALPAAPGSPPMPALPPVPAVPPVPAIAPLPPGVAAWTHIGAPRGPGVASSLGSKDIEGVKANGERTTWTIEAGKLGNEKPIVITRDVWTSPDLMVTVMTRDADPRVGETTYRLANLKRGEPDAGLMRVPADYAVNQGTFMPKAPGGAASKG